MKLDHKQLSTTKGIEIKGPLLIKPKIFRDERGFFYESWNQKLFNNTVGEEVNFHQDNHSSCFFIADSTISCKFSNSLR